MLPSTYSHQQFLVKLINRNLISGIFTYPSKKKLLRFSLLLKEGNPFKQENVGSNFYIETQPQDSSSYGHCW